jgi:SagB-type dehydrogenase family enzyme
MTDGIGKEFMQKTKPQALEQSLQKRGVPQPPLEIGYDPSIELIPLPSEETITAYPIDLRKAIDQRRTLRRYAKENLTLNELTFLLWTTQGVKAVTKRPVTFRTVPSAGARHAFETYILVNSVQGLKQGLYRYIALEHALLPLETDINIAQQLSDACLEQKQVTESAVTFIWVADMTRMYWRYGERGYRYIHLDAGHVCQNLYLAAEAIHSGVCAIAAFDDDKINAVLKLDGEQQFVVYLGTVGKRSSEENV